MKNIMKWVSFSFDDGRLDTYEVARPIMQKYGFTGTVNIISSFMLHPNNHYFKSSPRVMTPEQVVIWQREGGEIASHGRTHKNSAKEIVKSIEELDSVGIDTDDIGFASPTSWLTKDNMNSVGVESLLEKRVVTYLRSGIQIRREGVLYIVLSVLEQLTHSKLLYWILNKKNIINVKHKVYPSVAIKDYTSVAQIKYIINRSHDNDAIILMFHSILPKKDSCYGKDHYFWDADKFSELCEWLSNQGDIAVINTRDLIKSIENK